MPLPKPKENENKNDFMKRCMSDRTMREEYEDEDQRYAVCRAQWKEETEDSVKTIAISGIIGWEVLAEDIREKLTEAAGDDIDIEVSSPGGLVSEGLEIYNLIKNYQGNKTTHLMGLAASMASYIVLAGDKITAEDNAVYMIHNARGIALGDQNELRKTANIIEGMSSTFAKAYSKKSGKPIAEIKQMMNEETYLFGNEILDAGFVDEIIPAGDGPETKEEAVALADYAMSVCEEKLKEAKDDAEKAVAMISQFTMESKPALPDTNKTAAKAEESKEAKGMTLEELKKENPSVYAEAVEEGRNAERERRNALKGIAAGDAENESLSAVIEEAIVNGIAVNDVALQTKVNVAIRDGKKLDGENPPVVATEAAGEEEAEESKVESFRAKIRNMA